MKDLKALLVKVQTLDIKINGKNELRQTDSPKLRFYDISHENPALNQAFKNELRKLKEQALVDLLSQPREQIAFQLQGLRDLKALFSKFWDRYLHSTVPLGTANNQELLASINLDDMFICPFLSFQDHAEITDYFMDDLESTIRYRQQIVEELERSAAKILIESSPSGESDTPPLLPKKSVPTFKAAVLPPFINIIKEHFAQTHHQALHDLLQDKTSPGEALIFEGAGNKLADAFKQLYDANLIVGCNKVELEHWILRNFSFRDKGVVKSFTEKYLQDMISSNTKACQSPLFDVRKTGDEFVLYPLIRNNKNRKK